MISLLSKFVTGRALERTGLTLITLSLVVLLLHFFPVLKEEVKYQLLPSQEGREVVSATEQEERHLDPARVIVPVNEEFGIIIPKIGANATVIPDVDWQDPSVYQWALTRGVAQARGSVQPGEKGTVFLFAHSGVDLLQANRYNALFYLIDKLYKGDEIVLFYRKKKFTYHVIEKKIVPPEHLEYLAGNPDQKTITLMTCFPAGTTLERLIVIAEQEEH